MAVQQSAGDVIVTVAEDRCSDGDGVAEDSLCSVTAAVDLRLHFFDNDAFASLYRFHITQFSDATSGFHGIAVVHTLRGSVKKLKGCSLEDASEAPGVCRPNVRAVRNRISLLKS